MLECMNIRISEIEPNSEANAWTIQNLLT